MNENVSQSFGLGFENGNSRKNHPCPALLRSYYKLRKTCEIGVFSKSDTLEICKILSRFFQSSKSLAVWKNGERRNLGEVEIEEMMNDEWWMMNGEFGEVFVTSQ